MTGLAYRNTVVSLDDENDALHRQLAYFNRSRLSPGGNIHWHAALREDMRMKLIEGEFIERERHVIGTRARDIPADPDGFVDWYHGLISTGPGQADSLFPWLAESATYEQMRWFLHQEVAGEAGFEDLVALTQLKMPEKVKLEMARNYWDEMGRGNQSGMHGPMLGRLTHEFSLAPTPETTVWEALALGNLMVGLAVNRRYAYHSAGALGIIELTAPGRAAYVAQGLRRLGVKGKSRLYFELHAALDVRHSEAWNREVIHTLVAADPNNATPIAEGALLRLQAGRRCFMRYREELGLSA